MFVSSYGTYVDANALAKPQKTIQGVVDKKSKLFSNYLTTNALSSQKSDSTTPLSYTQTPKVLYNKERIASQQEHTQNSNAQNSLNLSRNIATTLNIQNAFESYLANAKPFSPMKRPQATLNQTPTIDENSSKELQLAKESALRKTMLSTYAANDFYYKITAS
jgi:hypothetical protein